MDEMQNIKPRLSPKDFFLYLAAVVTLYWSAITLINLLFETINRLYPDAVYNYVDFSNASFRWSVASLVIIFPCHIIVSWIINRNMASNPEKRNLGFRKWLIYLTLFLSGAAIITDLIVLLNTFLGGEITARFFWKVLVVLIVAGGIFGYYLYDLRRDATGKKTALYAISWASVIVVIGSLIWGFAVIGSPQNARLTRFDQQKISDLQNIQNQIVYQYWQPKRKLPNNLSEIENPIIGFTVPKDPQTDAPYAYRKLGDLRFELCADFNFDSSEGRQNNYRYPFIGAKESNWSHGNGNVCFERAIDPSLFPVVPLK